MFRLMLLVALLAALFGCNASNSKAQKQWPGSDQSAKNQKSTNTETGPNTPAGKTTNQNDKHTENLAKPAEHNPNPQENPGDTTQQNNKDPRTQGTTSGSVPKK